MALYDGKIHNLEQLEESYWDMSLPKCFSFCGILESISVIDEVRHIVSTILPLFDDCSEIMFILIFRTKYGFT